MSSVAVLHKCAQSGDLESANFIASVLKEMDHESTKPEMAEVHIVNKLPYTKKMSLHDEINETTWEWNWRGGKQKIFFLNDGVIKQGSWEKQGLTVSWKTIDRRTVMLEITSGRSTDKRAILLFNEDIIEYSGYGFLKNNRIKPSRRLK